MELDTQYAGGFKLPGLAPGLAPRNKVVVSVLVVSRLVTSKTSNVISGGEQSARPAPVVEAVRTVWGA